MGQACKAPDLPQALSPGSLPGHGEVRVNQWKAQRSQAPNQAGQGMANASAELWGQEAGAELNRKGRGWPRKQLMQLSGFQGKRKRKAGYCSCGGCPADLERAPAL